MALLQCFFPVFRRISLKIGGNVICFVWVVSTEAQQGQASVWSIIRHNFSKTDGKQAELGIGNLVSCSKDKPLNKITTPLNTKTTFNHSALFCMSQLLRSLAEVQSTSLIVLPVLSMEIIACTQHTQKYIQTDTHIYTETHMFRDTHTDI